MNSGALTPGLAAYLDQFIRFEKRARRGQAGPAGEMDDVRGIVVIGQQLVRYLAGRSPDPGSFVEDRFPGGIICNFVTDQDVMLAGDIAPFCAQLSLPS